MGDDGGRFFAVNPGGSVGGPSLGRALIQSFIWAHPDTAIKRSSKCDSARGG